MVRSISDEVQSLAERRSQEDSQDTIDIVLTAIMRIEKRLISMETNTDLIRAEVSRLGSRLSDMVKICDERCMTLMKLSNNA